MVKLLIAYLICHKPSCLADWRVEAEGGSFLYLSFLWNETKSLDIVNGGGGLSEESEQWMVAGGQWKEVITERMSDPQVCPLGVYSSHIFHPRLKGSVKHGTMLRCEYKKLQEKSSLSDPRSRNWGP